MVDRARLAIPVADGWRLVSDRTRLGGLVLWAGLLFPLVVDQVRTRDQVLSAELSPLELVRGGLPVLLFVVGVLLARPRVRPLTRTEAAAGLFLLVVVASTAWSIVHWATLLKAGSLVVAYLTIMAIARLDERRGASSVDSLALVVYLVVVLALVQLAVAPGAVMIQVDGPGTPNRLQGILPAIAADVLGFFAAIGVLLAGVGAGPQWTRGRWVRAGLIVACLVVLALTRARAAAILLVIGAVLLLARPALTFIAAMPRERRRWLAAGVAAVALAVVAGVVVEHSLVLSVVTRDQTPDKLFSLSGRTVTWGDALGQWVHRPLTGFGYYAGHRFAIPVRIGWENLQSLDSMWVELLIDVGVVGLVAMVLVLASAVHDLVRPSVADRHLAVRRVIFVLGFLASFVNPSLQAYTFALVPMAFVCLGAPRLQPRS